MAFIVGAIIGATAGTQDIESGVFRDLAATGRSRIALFASRVAGAWAVVLPILAVTAGLAAAGCVALAGSLAAPGAGAIVQAGALRAGRRRAQRRARGRRVRARRLARPGDRHPARVLPRRSRPSCQGVGFLGDARQALPTSAINRIGDLEPGPRRARRRSAPRSLVVARLVGWPRSRLGAWRTRTREI